MFDKDNTASHSKMSEVQASKQSFGNLLHQTYHKPIPNKILINMNTKK